MSYLEFPTIKLTSSEQLTSSSEFANSFGELLRKYQLVFIDIRDFDDGKFAGLIKNMEMFFPKMMNDLTMSQRDSFDNGFFREGTYYSPTESEYGNGENRFWLHFCDNHEAYLSVFDELSNTEKALPEVFRDYFLTIQSIFPKIEMFGSGLLNTLERYLGVDENAITTLVFDKHNIRPTENTLLSIEYTPPKNMPGNVEIEGMAEHTGPCLATIGITQTQLGLQIKRGNNWLTVPHMPGHVFFMADDQLDTLSRKERTHFPAVPHRVQMMNRPRTSILYFMAPFKDAKTGPNGETSYDYVEGRHPKSKRDRSESELYVVGRD